MFKDFFKENVWKALTVFSWIVILILIWYVIKPKETDIKVEHLIPHIIIALVIILSNVITAIISVKKLKPTSNKLKDTFENIENSRQKFIDSNPMLEKLFDKMVERRAEEIAELATEHPKFKSEPQRELFIDDLFANLKELKGTVTKIQSLSWDYQEYVLYYWGEIIKTHRLQKRNDNAAEENMNIERLFIFRRKHYDTPKDNAFRFLCVQNALNSNSKIRWLFEDDLGWTEQQLRQVRSSFLLLLDSGNHVKILTENYQPPNEFVDPPSTAQFYMKNENIPGLQHSRFEELWNKGREVPNPWKYLLTIK